MYTNGSFRFFKFWFIYIVDRVFVMQMILFAERFVSVLRLPQRAAVVSHRYDVFEANRFMRLVSVVIWNGVMFGRSPVGCSRFDFQWISSLHEHFFSVIKLVTIVQVCVDVVLD
uniref:Uncharacterized protein n=1 Tax=Cacopsylla melanoneura TaxID=428564 RepID=A0A8D8RRW8_9HEMI